MYKTSFFCSYCVTVENNFTKKFPNVMIRLDLVRNDDAFYAHCHFIECHQKYAVICKEGSDSKLSDCWYIYP